MWVTTRRDSSRLTTPGWVISASTYETLQQVQGDMMNPFNCHAELVSASLLNFCERIVTPSKPNPMISYKGSG